MKKILDTQMFQTIVTEIGLSIDENANAHELFKTSASSHIEWLNILDHDKDDLNDCFQSDEPKEKIKDFLSRMDGGDKKTDTEIYNAIIPLVANCIEWLMWIRDPSEGEE